MKFPSLEVAPCVYKCTIRPCVEYCCHLCAVVTWIWWISYRNRYGELLVLHLFAVANLSLSYRYYFGNGHLNLMNFLHFLILVISPIVILHDFSVINPRHYKAVYVNSFLPRTSRLWNSLTAECFTMIYDLNGFSSKVNRHLLSLVSF